MESFGIDESYGSSLAIDPETKQYRNDVGHVSQFVLEEGMTGAFVDGIHQPGLWEEIVDALNKATIDGKPLAEVSHGMWDSKDEAELNREVEKFRSDIYETIVGKHNAMYRHDSALQIMDFSMKIDDMGKLTITGVQTAGNDPRTNVRAEQFLNRELTGEIKEKAERLAFEILFSRQSKHGDVLMAGTVLEPIDNGVLGTIKQFKHEIFIPSGFDPGYQVLRCSSLV